MASREPVRITPPDNSLRKKIGAVKLNRVFTPEKIQACQEAVDAAYSDLFREALENIVTMEKDYAQMIAHPFSADMYLEHINRVSEITRKKMDSLGMKFGSEVVKSLHDYVCTPPDEAGNGEVCLVLGKHLEILHSKFREGAQENDEEIERQILDSLKALIAKGEKY